MGIGSGLGGSVGVAAETTYGTYVAPARFFQVNKADLKKVKNTAQGGGIAGGRLVQPGARRVVTSEASAGSIELEVTDKDFGFWLAQIFGGTVTPVQQGATAAYLQTHPLADTFGKSASIQLGVPNAGGTVLPYTHKGCKVTSVEFSCAKDELLKATIELDGRQASEVESLAAVSYPAVERVPFHFAQMAVKLGAVGAETSVSGVKGVSVKIERGMSVDSRFYAGAAGLKAEPVANDFVKISGSLDVDLVDKTLFHDRFAADSNTSLVLEWVGPIIASTYAKTFRLKLPQTFFDGDSPTLDSNDMVSGAIPFSALYDLTNAPVTAEYLSADTAL